MNIVCRNCAREFMCDHSFVTITDMYCPYFAKRYDAMQKEDERVSNMLALL